MTLGEFRKKTKKLPNNTEIVRDDLADPGRPWLAGLDSIVITKANVENSKWHRPFFQIKEDDGKETVILL